MTSGINVHFRYCENVDNYTYFVSYTRCIFMLYNIINCSLIIMISPYSYSYYYIIQLSNRLYYNNLLEYSVYKIYFL
jgi:hypothetical protein